MPGAIASETIPGPSSLPLLGWWDQSMRLARDPLAFLLARYHRYGSISALMRDDPAIIFALGPAANHQMISHDQAWSSTVGELASLHTPLETGHRVEGVVRRDEADRRSIAVHRDITVSLTQHMLDRWGLGCLIDVSHVMYELSLQIAVATLFGRDRAEATQQLARVVRRWSHYLTAPLPGLRGRLFVGNDGHAHHLATELATIVEVLDDRRHDDTSLRHAVPFLVMAPAWSAAILTWTLFLLGQHPRVLADLRAELARVLVGGAPALDQLADLPVLDRIVKESLRLFPPVSVDCCMLSAALELGPYRAPEGTIVVYSPYITHHLPDRYLNPQHFRPERWLYIEPERHEYLPFGACSNLDDAAAVAVLHTRLILAMVVQRYTLGLAPGARIDPSAGVLLVPKGRLAMVIAPPDRSVTRRIPQGMVRKMVILP